MAIWQATLLQRLEDVALANVFYISEDDVLVDPTIYQAEATDIGGAIALTLRTATALAIQYDALALRRITSPTTPAVIGPVNLTGSRAGDYHPSFTCAVSNHYSQPGTANRRGRWFFSGIVESDTSQGRLFPATVLLFEPFITLMGTGHTSANGIDYTFGHFSQVDQAFFEFQTIGMSGRLSRLRSRLAAPIVT